MIAEVVLDLIGLEFGEILSPASAIHDGEGNRSSQFGNVGSHGAPHRKSTRRRVNVSATGSAKVLKGSQRKKKSESLELTMSEDGHD